MGSQIRASHGWIGKPWEPFGKGRAQSNFSLAIPWHGFVTSPRQSFTGHLSPGCSLVSTLLQHKPMACSWALAMGRTSLSYLPLQHPFICLKAVYSCSWHGHQRWTQAEQGILQGWWAWPKPSMKRDRTALILQKQSQPGLLWRHCVTGLLDVPQNPDGALWKGTVVFWGDETFIRK